MSESTPPPSPTGDGAPEARGPGRPDDELLGELRELLVGDERERLDRLTRRLDDPEETLRAVADVLPEAVRRRSESDDKLTRAMAPSIDDVIRESVRRRPKVLADALFPVMGPAIRKSIVDTLQRFVQSLNQALEHSLSPRSFRWRLEAWRTGRPFAEVVLSRTLLYRVEQVFLIHGETGLLLRHVAIPQIDTEDSDMVSGMLTAIQDFVRDSFGGEGDRNSGLRSASVGELTLWAEAGPSALVAIVIRGTPPESLRDSMSEVLEDLHVTHGEALADFEGDAAPFASAEDSLHLLLVEQGQEFARKKGRGPRLALAFLGVIGLLIAIWVFFDVRDRVRWKAFLRDVESSPGVVITAEDRGDRKVRGLRDPLADDPAGAFHRHFDADEELEASFGLFRSNDAEIVVRRARRLLDLPEDVEDTLGCEAGVLSARGRASSAAIAAAAAIAPRIPGVERVDFSGIERSDAEARAARRRIVEILRATEGVVVLGDPDPERAEPIEILVDPAAEARLAERLRDGEGSSLLARGGVELRRGAFRSADAAVLRDRITAALGWPEGLELEGRDAVLRFRGRLPARWSADLLARPELWSEFVALDFASATVVEDPARALWERFVQALRETPGIVVTEASEGRGPEEVPRVRGFRDPLADDVGAIARGLGYEGRFTAALAPHASAHPVVAERRFRRAFSPPDALGSAMREDGTLVLSGRAPRAWWATVREAAAAIPGVARLDIAGLEIFDPLRPLEADWVALRRLLDAEPGYRVDVFERRDDRLRLEGRRDPLARPLGALLAEAGVEDAELEPVLRDYVSAHPVIALERARVELDPPAGVELTMRDRTLVARGDAPTRWRTRLLARAPAIAGIDAVDVRELRDFDRRELERRLERLAVRVIVFGDGETQVGANQEAELDAAAADLQGLLEAAGALGLELRIEVLGLPDRLDVARSPAFEADPEFYRGRRTTALDRAVVVKRLLVERAADLRERLFAHGANERAWRSPEEGALARRLGPAVIFRGAIVDR